MILHVVLALGLIVFVLLHSGKGTGLSSMLGGFSSAASGTTSSRRTSTASPSVLPSDGRSPRCC
jgi:protein translocase SecG subunit